MAVNTKYFTSAMTSAPAMSGSVGAMIGVLDACLKDGFNTQTLTSLVVASDVATGTKTTHGYAVHQVIVITGASPAALNDEWIVTSVTADEFTFATTGISDQTASGTIVCKVAAAGWEKQFSGTNLAVYRSTDVLSSLIPIKIDDTVGQYSSAILAESWTDIATAVNSCGTKYFRKSSTTDATARPYILVADVRTFYIGIDWNSAGTYDFYSFGDFATTVAADGYNSRLMGHLATTATKGSQLVTPIAWCEDVIGNLGYALVPRNYAQIVGAISAWQMSLCAASFPGSGNTTYQYLWAVSGNHGYQANVYGLFPTPSLADSGYHFVPVYIAEKPAAGRVLRGTQRGLLHVIEQIPQTTGFQVLTGVTGVAGNKVVLVAANANVWNNGHIYVACSVAISLGDW
jgi:hypothetical protein